MKKNELIKNNKGFSLVELIVVVLITAILMLAVTAFLSTSRSAYQTVSTSATLQEESMTVDRVLQEFLMEAKSHGDLSASDLGDSGAKIIWVTARDNTSKTGDCAYFFVLDLKTETLKYCKGKTNWIQTDGTLSGSGKQAIGLLCYGDNEDYSKIADHVKSIAVKKSKTNTENGTDLVCLDLRYEYMGKEFINNLTVTTRNKNHDIADPEDPDEDT